MTMIKFILKGIFIKNNEQQKCTISERKKLKQWSERSAEKNK